MMHWRTACFLLVLAVLVGCGTKAIDYPLAIGQRNQQGAPLDASPDRPLVLIAFSGGGSRAAALGASVVERLNRLSYAGNGVTRTLADDIAVTSSVSGGSVYNADLALRGPGHAGTFRERIQSFKGIEWLASRALNPINWVTATLRGKTRVDLQQAMIEELLDTHATMAEINRTGPQVTLFNASDMVSGQVFTFDRTTIDDLCMDYEKVPVSLAVNASAAVPGAFTPVLLRNDSYVAGVCREPDKRRATLLPYATSLQREEGAYTNPERFITARYRQTLRNESIRQVDPPAVVPPFRTPEYLRLVDGGVADNSGLTALRRALLNTGSPTDLGRLFAGKKVRRIVVIVVNASNDPKSDLDLTPKYTTLADTAGGAIDTLIDSASGNATGAFDDFVKQLIADGASTHTSFTIYPIAINFDQMPVSTPDERKQQQDVKNIATSWTLRDGDTKLLDEAADLLLWRHPCFAALVTDMSLHYEGTPGSSPIPGTACPVARPAGG